MRGIARHANGGFFAECVKITRSGDQSSLFSNLYGLGSTLCLQLVEQSAGVGLHRVLADRELGSDLAGAQALRNRGENLQLPRRDAELQLTRAVDGEWLERHPDLHGDRDFLDDNGLPGP